MGTAVSHGDVDQRLVSGLRVATSMLGARVAALLQLEQDRETCRAVVGLEFFPGEITGEGLASATSGWSLESAQDALQKWPTHPLVVPLRKDIRNQALLVRVLRGVTGAGVALCILLPKTEISDGERASVDELANLLSLVLKAETPDPRPLESFRPLDDFTKEHWLYRQIVHQLPERLLFVFDHELKLRLMDGTITFPLHTGSCAVGVGASLDELDCGANGPKLRDACARALKGETLAQVLGCGGRFYDLRTAPLRDLSGAIVMGFGLIHDKTEDPARDAIERLLSARLRTLVDSMDSGILVEDENQVIQHCNQHFCTLMQISERADSLIGKASPELIERISPVFFIPEALSERIEELKAERKVTKDELVYLADMRILERSYSPLELDGKAVGHLWTYRDVSDRERNKDLLQRQADQLRALSLVDELTGLYNRRGFLTLATQQLKLCDRSMRSALLVFVDLDGMKRINDELGHEYGDVALVETASVLRQCFRYSDVVARLGGDEFVVLAVEADPPSVEGVTERLYEKLAEMNARPERKFELKFSVGIAPYDPSKLEMVEEVLARADSLMYEQKRLRKSERKS
ncbi:MAG: diguanylate cyclase [Polyangiaceae bacterium]